jgi:hypothetical protein
MKTGCPPDPVARNRTSPSRPPMSGHSGAISAMSSRWVAMAWPVVLIGI